MKRIALASKILSLIGAKRSAGLAALVLAASLAIAAPANATVYLSNTPTWNLSSVVCLHTSGQMLPQLTVDGANLYYAYPETQRVYVQFVLYSLTTGQSTITTGYFYGDATGFDNPFVPQWDHVQTWFSSATGAPVSNYTPFVWNINRSGTYQVAVRFAWDRSTAGASASGWTNWVWEPGTCAF
jgi:hypothetical protein